MELADSVTNEKRRTVIGLGIALAVSVGYAIIMAILANKSWIESARRENRAKKNRLPVSAGGNNMIGLLSWLYYRLFDLS